jgi:hypothetical protein
MIADVLTQLLNMHPGKAKMQLRQHSAHSEVDNGL